MKRAFALFAAIASIVGSVQAAPVRPDHPLLGLWRLPYPNSTCAEIYRIEPDGTTLVTSFFEVAESVFTVSDLPGVSGFYTWVDRVVRDNGEKDCSGRVSAPGAEVTRYILLHPAGQVFVMCEDEDETLKRCVGPFIRLTDADA